MDYLYLLIAIISEVVATTALKASERFSKLYPAITVIVGYVLSFTLLSLVLKNIPIGIAYSCWAGIGIVSITIIGYLLYDQKLDGFSVTGITLIVIGIILINCFSKTIKN